MTCAACVSTIENIVRSSVPGVTSVNINLATGNTACPPLAYLRTLAYARFTGRALVKGSQEVSSAAVVKAIEAKLSICLLSLSLCLSLPCSVSVCVHVHFLVPYSSYAGCWIRCQGGHVVQ